MKDLSLSAAEISEVLETFLTATKLELTFRVLPQPGQVPDLVIEFGGPDVSWLTASDAELLRAFEVLAGEIRSPEYPELLLCQIGGEKD